MQEDDGVRKVNQYILKREIGRGSFGVVHLGIDSTTGEEFVLALPFYLSSAFHLIMRTMAWC